MHAKNPGAPVSVSNRPPPSEAAIPPVRPAPSEKPTPELRHSVGKTWAATAYRPTCTAQIAAPATAIPPMSAPSPAVRHNTDPPVGFEKTDTLTTINLVYELK